MTFERDLSILADSDDFITTTARKIGVNIDRRVVLETPRDTGTAKASWLVTIGQPTNATVEKEGEDVGQAQTQAIAQGAATVGRFKSGQVLYIQNNQPYIERLNEGYSDQAPSHYVDSIIMEEVNRD